MVAIFTLLPLLGLAHPPLLFGTSPGWSGHSSRVRERVHLSTDIRCRLLIILLTRVHLYAIRSLGGRLTIVHRPCRGRLYAHGSFGAGGNMLKINRKVLIGIAVVGFLIFVRIMAGRQEEQCDEAMSKVNAAFSRQAYDDARHELTAAANVCKSLRESERRDTMNAINAAQGIEMPAAKHSNSAPAPSVTTPSAQEAPSLVGANGEVSAAKFGDDWPLKVSAGRIVCRPPSMVFFQQTPGGPLYAVNGSAGGCIGSKHPGCNGIKPEEINPIWADDTKLGQGLKKSIGPLISAGLRYCEGREK